MDIDKFNNAINLVSKREGITPDELVTRVVK
jgi:hypothetical protein